ncbi:hypothetical protein ES676_01960 [Bizionia saleffrena]|uniref:Uncharacterized protein n=1 Tax=Bizionia saleffrena TaxID=291189 RepID=A0A8H2LG73_9FLAO|nr:hypothetical protein [Bizionia saleffrena]TYB78006.1 hypothetical protein ES676_01960 [Bizionia saleffrena]
MNLKNYIVAAFITLFCAVNLNAQKKKVAVVGFYSDKIIGFSELNGVGEALLTEVLKLRDNPDFDLTPMLNNYHDAFFNDYAKDFPFDLVPEKEVLANEVYQAFVPKYELDDEALKRYVFIDGYKHIYEGALGKVNEEAVAKMFSDIADGVLFVEVHFDLTKGFGIGSTATVKMKAFTRISLYDKTGKKVFVINESAQSKKTSVMVGGIPVMKTTKILPMCESALERLMKDLDKRLPKIIKKADKL